MRIHLEPLLIEHCFQCWMPNAKGRVQRQSRLERVVAIDVLWASEWLHRIVTISLRHCTNLIWDIRINQLQIEPFPRESVGEIVRNWRDEEWIARLVYVLVVILHTASKLVVAWTIDVGGIRQLHLCLANRKRESQRRKPIAVSLALFCYIQIIVIIVKVDVFIAKPCLHRQ